MTQAELDKQIVHTGTLGFNAPSRFVTINVVAEHCLEHFRELVMCRGDIALTMFLYRGGKKTAKLLAEHECVNWNKLENWVSDRVIDISIPNIVLFVEESDQFEQPSVCSTC